MSFQVELETEVNPLVQNAVFALRDVIDFQILKMLLNRGPKSFTELKKALNLNPVVTDRRLKRLMNGALVEHYYSKKEGSTKYSFYDVTKLAAVIIEKLQELEKPHFPERSSKIGWYNPTHDIESFEEELKSLLQSADKITSMMKKTGGLMHVVP